MHEALFTKTYADKSVKCNLCPNYCLIRQGEFGSCRSRKNVSGLLMAINYGRTVTINLDPIEKKPLYHYYPGSEILSLGANSCNLHCEFCQNYEISQQDCPTKIMYPDELLDLMLRKNLKQVAFTYTEPITWYEYILECGKLLTEKGIRLVLVTNGFINQEPLKNLLPYIDAMNIDLKSSRNSFYQTICKGELQPVLETIRTAEKYCHLELTNLLIPGLNDTEDEIIELVNFIAEINPKIPLHFSRYYPQWKCKQPITPEKILQRAFEIACGKLDYVYIGNVPSGEHSDTHCPQCNTLLISRGYMRTEKANMIGNKCSNCNTEIYGYFG